MSMTGAVIFLPREGNAPSLMLQELLFDPAARWLAQALADAGVERFFVVCHSDDREAAQACFPEGAEFVTGVSEDAVEHLVAFKTAYNGAVQALRQCLAAYFPAMTEGDVEDFLYLFLPFMFGLYPYTTVTDKQKEAMRLAGVSYPSLTAGALACAFTQKLLAPWLA